VTNGSTFRAARERIVGREGRAAALLSCSPRRDGGVVTMVQIKRVLAASFSVLLFVTVLSACGSSKPKGSSAAPSAGTWSLDVSFGSATITVNKAGTLVTNISFEFTCGSADSAKGSIGATKGNPGWAIDKSGKFAFEGVPFYFNLMDDSGNTAGGMSGQFESGKSASGDWNLIVNDGTKCSASWTASR
jgi:hypothetical protein